MNRKRPSSKICKMDFTWKAWQRFSLRAFVLQKTHFWRCKILIKLQLMCTNCTKTVPPHLQKPLLKFYKLLRQLFFHSTCWQYTFLKSCLVWYPFSVKYGVVEKFQVPLKVTSYCKNSYTFKICCTCLYKALFVYYFYTL